MSRGRAGSRRTGRLGAPEPRGLDRIAHEHGDGERSHAAGNGSEGTGNFDGIGMDIDNPDSAFLFEQFKTVREFSKDAGSVGRLRDTSNTEVTQACASEQP